MTKGDRIQDYIEKYAKDRGISVEEARSHKIVQQYIDYIRKEDMPECPEMKKTLNVACGVDES